MKSDFLFVLGTTEENLTNDIQALAYIQEELNKNQDGFLDLPFIKNSVETLLKSMIYNQDNLKQEIKKIEEENKYVKPIPINK